MPVISSLPTQVQPLQRRDTANTTSSNGTMGSSSNDAARWECPCCGKGFQRKYNCERHIWEVCQSPGETFFCPYPECLAPHKRRSRLKAHFKKHFAPDKNMIKRALEWFDSWVPDIGYQFSNNEDELNAWLDSLVAETATDTRTQG
ncbi:Zinc finger protein 58 [Lasiodiplodia theobromae]|uniref:Zinc finger protein 58 n=1 Tax=Lasiodiplodia theobromae TaxID=45133 RepID=UPI0015C3CFFC|nr:Zinc finger protein 58 [Lasiodiplodia theobromae]KAF4533921.1 Zinc finger protein 58 [Lasiodiplodia theobromae]